MDSAVNANARIFYPVEDVSCRPHYLIKCLLDEIDEDEKYTDWERKFVWDIAKRIEKEPWVVLTEKQEACLEKIWDK